MVQIHVDDLASIHTVAGVRLSLMTNINFGDQNYTATDCDNYATLY